MNEMELADWMEAHGIGQLLQAWVNNNVMATRNYAVLEDLMTKGFATIKLRLVSPEPFVFYLKVENALVYEEELSRCQYDLGEANKTIKDLKKTVNALEQTQAEAVVAEETEALESKVRRVRKA